MSDNLWDYKWIILGNIVFSPLMLPMFISQSYKERMSPILSYLVCWEFKELREYLKHEKK